MNKTNFSILISTKNRIVDLRFTLEKIRCLALDDCVEVVVFDDGSNDGTFEFVTQNYPNIILFRNVISKGYLYCRNKMLNETKADYSISLDDDAHFVTKNPLDAIKKHFDKNSRCGVIALRIFWGLKEPTMTSSNEQTQQVQGFVGCAHAWRMEAWRAIPNYPEWFVFYGEENYATYQLFKRSWEIHYLPEVLVNHRVDVQSRRNNTDYAIRLRRSLRSGWYLFFLFYPLKKIPRKMAYSLWIQFKLKVFKGDLFAMQAILLALMDLLIHMPKIIVNSNRLTKGEIDRYQKLPVTKIFWKQLP